MSGENTTFRVVLVEETGDRIVIGDRLTEPTAGTLQAILSCHSPQRAFEIEPDPPDDDALPGDRFFHPGSPR